MFGEQIPNIFFYSHKKYHLQRYRGVIEGG
jgi:hypothetical protein